MLNTSVCILLVECHPPMYGNLNCSRGTTTAVFGETCKFSCKRSFELLGSSSGTCLANQNWSEGNPKCEASKGLHYL